MNKTTAPMRAEVFMRVAPYAEVSDGWPSSNFPIAKQHGGPAIRSTEN